MTNNFKPECSFCNWYPIFAKDSLEAKILKIPDRVYNYLQHEAFVLPLEATKNDLTSNTEWTDGKIACNNSSEETEEEENDQPSFPEFSERLQAAIDEYGALFVKSNWRSPSDATWVAPTKSLKCTSLEDIYLLLKSSDRIADDLNAVDDSDAARRIVSPCLVLKRWRDVVPATEFRCFVVGRELVGICQRDSSQYYQHIESEKYDIKRDVTSLFDERIKTRFELDDYSFDVIRYKKDKVKIVDFGALDETSTSGTLFSLEELLLTGKNDRATTEFRYIAENVGIQPTLNNHFCVPREIDEYFRSGVAARDSPMDVIRKEVANQNEA